MDGRQYLKSYGWREGEPLRVGGLKRPILVKHKYDRQGLGSAIGHADGEAWWERLFDGHLKNLDINSTQGGITFDQKEATASGLSKSCSPLYRRFIRGQGLKGTINLSESSSALTAERKKEDNGRRKTKISKNKGQHESSKKRIKKKKRSRKKEKKLDK